MVGINPYQEKISIKVVTDGFGEGIAKTGAFARAGVEANLELEKSGKKLADAMDKRSHDSLRQLEDDIKQAGETADAASQGALKTAQALAKQAPAESLKGDYFEMPEIGKEYAEELQAMKANFADFKAYMEERGITIDTTAETMGEDVEATMGGDFEKRKAGIAVTQEMLQDQENIVKSLSKERDLRLKNLGYLEDQKEQKKLLKEIEDRIRYHLEKELELKKKLYDKLPDKRKKHAKDAKKEIKELELGLSRSVTEGENLTKEIKRLDMLTEQETKSVKDLNDELSFSKKRVDDLKDSKNSQLTVDRDLSAISSKQRKDENEAMGEYKKRETENNKIRQKTVELLKRRQRLAKEFNQQIEAMANSFKTTLVGALAISTAATTAFFNKLDGVRQSFQAFEQELMNAQSIFQTNQETLFGLSDEIVNFGNQYGVSMQNASQGLYTLASAGLNAEESMEVLNNTLKLSMAVQGDHETIAKLTTQTIFGFGLEMSDSAELTDKFAHAINKSLIEYQDLASAVKFAMPFFTSTGQSVDQLLGSLEILTNRALEAGIAGRGLRQALAEFAQHADDNTAAFAKLGVEITNTDGTFKQLTEIAKEFQVAMGPMASDVDLMTTLLEDLNVRGATAFVHLVQNADEFEHAVNDLQNSAGAATEMADIQQQSLAMSIERIKNALQTPFLLSDEVGKQHGYMNEFSMVLHQITDQLEGMFVIVEEGVVVGLTPMGEMIREFVITALHEFYKLVQAITDSMMQMSEEGTNLTGLIQMMTVPMSAAIKLLGKLGPLFLESALIMKLMNGLLPMNNMLMAMRLDLMDAEQLEALESIWANGALEFSMESLGAAYSKLALSQAGISIGLFGMIYLTRKFADGSRTMAAVIGGLTGAFFGLAFAIQIYNAGVLSTLSGPMAFITMAGLIVATIAGFAALNVVMQDMMKAPAVDMPTTATNPHSPTADTGYLPIMDSGGLGNRHQSVMVEPGETIIPKTQNMLSGGGITLNIGGDIVTNDAEDFADRVAVVLPEALRRQNDIGGI